MESDSRERESNFRGAGERQRERVPAAASSSSSSSSSRPCAGFMSSKIRYRFFWCEGEIWVRNGRREVREDGARKERGSGRVLRHKQV